MIKIIMIIMTMAMVPQTSASSIYSNYPWTNDHPALYQYASKHKAYVLKNGRAKFKNYNKYKSKIKAIAKKYKVPPEIIVIAAIESSFRTDAVSKSGAVGMWQFMAPTARDMGLIVNKKTDERLDWKKSTVAAVIYIKWLAEEFGGDYETAVLAYNYGIGNVRKVSKEIKSREAFRIIDSGLLPIESEEYLLKFLTYLHLFEYLLHEN